MHMQQVWVGVVRCGPSEAVPVLSCVLQVQLYKQHPVKLQGTTGLPASHASGIPAYSLRACQHPTPASGCSECSGSHAAPRMQHRLVEAKLHTLLRLPAQAVLCFLTVSQQPALLAALVYRTPLMSS